LHFEVVATVRQRRPSPGNLVGQGKIEELRARLDALRSPDRPAPCVVVASDCSAGQLRSMSSSLDAEVLDRTEAILRVFEARARTRLSRLEIELARLTRALPRVHDDPALRDAEGGGGRGSRGHSNVELAKQRLRSRIATVRRELATQRELRRHAAGRRSELPRVALVGYTNAGKSSWMRALTRSPVRVEDRLFATVDTTVRALAHHPGRRVLVADTVGFMAGLPHDLLESFRSTLEEALDADLILQVADASHPGLELQLQVTREVLSTLETRARRSIVLLNKADRLDSAARSSLEARHPEALLVSAFDADDVYEVTSTVRAFVEDEL
jgi:GTP-binding protein HflX